LLTDNETLILLQDGIQIPLINDKEFHKF
jgi:hypothetical protein